MMKQPFRFGRVGVLMGGCSSEREISLKSGQMVTRALKQKGCEAVAIDISSTDSRQVIRSIRQAKADVVFIALHGEFGEDGGIQGILDEAAIAYTGSSAEASRTAMNKALAQRLVSDNGILVPDFQVLTGVDVPRLKEIFSVSSHPKVVKPSCGGSSIGTSLARSAEEFQRAVETALKYGEEVLVENFIQGREVTVGILGDEALPLIEIRPKKPFFDFTAKYQKGMSEYAVPAPVPGKVAVRVQRIALKVYHLLGCRDCSRVDFIIDEMGHIFFLEINTIPGMTEGSLLPMAAKELRISYPDLCLKILQCAVKRKEEVGQNIS